MHLNNYNGCFEYIIHNSNGQLIESNLSKLQELN